MKTQRFGRTGLEVGVISLGTEYLIEVPRETVVSVVREAVSAGINYFDVLFAYPHYRDNFGAAFEGIRDDILIAGHLGVTETDGQYRRTRDLPESRKMFDDLLARLGTDYVDVLFLSNCDEQDDYNQIMAPGGLLDVATELKEQGKARFLAFSGHKVPVSRQAVESGEVDVLMHTINLAGDATEGRKDLYLACAANDVGLIAMKPFAGGSLLREGATPAVTPVQCLSYAAHQVGVSTVLPGVKDVDELSAALATLEADDEQKDFSDAIRHFQHPIEGQCQYCNHCLPCPVGIDIAQMHRLLDAAASGLTDSLRSEYAAQGASAGDCVQCGECVDRCPFGVAVIENLERADGIFESNG